MGKKKAQETARVEFGSEFLDMNASKIYDVTSAENKKEKKKKNKE